MTRGRQICSFGLLGVHVRRVCGRGHKTSALAKRSVMLLVDVGQARVHRAGAAGLLKGAAGAESHVLCTGTP